MIRTMDSFTGTMVSLRIKIPSRYTTRTMTRIPSRYTTPNHDPNHDPNSEILSFYRCLSSFAHVGGLCIDSCLDIFCHSVVFAYHSICLYRHRVWDRFRHFTHYTVCMYRYRIGSAHLICHSAIFTHVCHRFRCLE